ncbi:MAG: hypothetical protein GYB65_01165 [Chloroflexi bacterium]|nr:hypothetical protein [Chloroflexota bacterium]
MVVRLLVAGGVVFGVVMALIAGARAWGRSETPPPLFLETGNCAQPCWQGLQPGVSTHVEFEQVSVQFDMFKVETHGRGDTVRAFDLNVMGDIKLGDVLLAFGTPDHVGCLGWTHTTRYPGKNLAVQAHIYFADGLIRVEAIRVDEVMLLHPDMQVRQISYFAPAEEPAYPIGATVWQGVAPSEAYPTCR